MSHIHTIVWFRQDCRLADQPALTAAMQQPGVLPIYILDDVHAKENAMGSASSVWLHHTLHSLRQQLGGNLSLYQGDAMAVFEDLLARFDIQSVYWNRCYEPWRIVRDTALNAYLTDVGIAVHRSDASLLWAPWTIKKKDGTPFKVFTPFYRKGCLQADVPREPLVAPDVSACLHDPQSLSLEDLALLPEKDWGAQGASHWDISEQGAHDQMARFFAEGLHAYKQGRNLPAKPYTSRLSPYLHMGQLSPNQVWHAVRALGDDVNVDHFCSELGWREFSYQLLFHNPKLPTENLQSKFDAFPWHQDAKRLQAWQRGQTGIPMVDAGMRELWQTGYMHNRVRMIVGSFLVKNLLLDWRLGERWFWDCLVDADLASNSASWQWVAGCGADAAPYFRIFNPVTQGQKFDPDGDYVRRYVPELAHVPNDFLFNPWEAPGLVLQAAGVTLGVDYPHPIVDLKASRQQALDAFATLKKPESS